MPKNTTLRGLAIAAITALGVSGFAVPAQAAGLDTGYVSLAPSSGTEYAIIAQSGATFSMSANEASTLNTGDLKFLVSDPSDAVEVATGTSGRTFTLAGEDSNNTFSTSASNGVVTVISSYSALVSAGDKFELSADMKSTTSGTLTVQVTASGQIFAVGTASSTVFQFDGGNLATLGAQKLSIPTTVKVLREARNTTDHNFVVDTGSNDSANASTLVLTVTSDTTRTVEVTAWKDSNDNDKIDSTEFVSPTRTVKFVKASELVVSTAMSVVPGDQTLSAKVKTEPVLNGNQTGADDINVGFTRQDDSTTVYGNKFSWNDTNKEFTVAVNLEADGTSIGAWTTAAGSTAGEWAVLDGADNLSNGITSVTTTSKTVTLVQTNPHNLRVGDKVTLKGSGASDIDDITFSVAVVAASNSFTINTSTVSTAVGTVANIDYEVTTYAGNQKSLVDRALPGTYTAQAYVLATAAGSKVTATATSATSDDLTFTTVASAEVQGGADLDAGTISIKKGALTVPVTINVYDVDGEVVTAGRPVVVTPSAASGDSFKVNGKTGAQTLTTDANGQVVLSVTSATGAVGSVTLTAVAENSATDTLVLNWVAQSYGLVDFTGTGNSTISQEITRTITTGGSYTLNLGVMDQWFAPAADASYRLVVTGSGTVEGVKALSAGRAAVTIADNGFQTAMATTITLQKDVSGTWTAQGRWVVTTNVLKTPGVVLGADASSLYGTTVDTSDLVAKKALVELDRRLTSAAVPSYTNDVVLAGRVVNSGTSAGQTGAEVVVTGPSNVLFFNGNVYKRGSITVHSDSLGNFSVTLYSTTAQTDTVITVTSMGKSATSKVTFTGIGVGEGKSLVITAPASVAPASTLQVKAKLTDTYGNAVQASAGRIKMTYTGAGIGFGTLPDSTDKNGELSYSVLLGAGDEGTITVVVSYDQNGDGDFVDTDDLSTTKTITVGAVEAEVNAVIGSFQGRWAVRVENAKGSTVTVKVGGKWYKYVSLNDNYTFSRKSKVGATVPVKVWVDGLLQNDQTITIK